MIVEKADKRDDAEDLADLLGGLEIEGHDGKKNMLVEPTMIRKKKNKEDKMTEE